MGLTNSQDRSFAADGIMGNRNTHSYNLDPIDQDVIPTKKLMAKNFLGSGMTYQTGAGKLIWGEGLPDPVIDIVRGPGDTDKKGFDLENGIPYYELENTI